MNGTEQERRKPTVTYTVSRLLSTVPHPSSGEKKALLINIVGATDSGVEGKK